MALAAATPTAGEKVEVSAMKRISCLMLDMGGVLTQDQNQEKLAEMMELVGAGCPRESFLSVYWKHRFDYDRGLIDGRAYWGRVAASLGRELKPSACADIIRTDLASWFNMRERMLGFLGGIRGKVGRLVLLSNINADGVGYIKSEAGRSWISCFDELILSCEHRLLKPEREIYELALDVAGALPAETLFIDDNRDNVEGALRAGMSSFQFVGEEEFATTLAAGFELVRA
jgi:putative hydrolase of the HAD superfamily